MNTIKPILLVSYLSLFFACVKDSELKLIPDSCPTVEEGGKEIPPYQGHRLNYQYVQSDVFLFDKPYSNPNNNDEFAFWLVNPIRCGIYTYNIKTKIRSLVMSTNPKKGIPQSQPRWGRNGWILFENIDHNIYKIKPTGDSLTQLTQTGREAEPEWNYEGTMFCSQYINNTYKYYTLFRNQYGDIIDSVQYKDKDLFLGQPDWQHKKYLLGRSNNDNVLLYDYKTKTITEIENKDVSSPRWINENEFIYASGGISTMNINTRQVKNIRKTKNDKVYWDISQLNNGQLLCSRSTSYLRDSIMEVVATKTSIFLVNPCDTNTIELNLR